MRCVIQSILVLFAGLLVGTSMSKGKSGSAFYGFSLDSRVVPPEAAKHYWNDAIGEKSELTDVQDAGRARKIVQERFREDLHRIQWTWDRELRWKQVSQKPESSSNSSPAGVSP